MRKRVFIVGNRLSMIMRMGRETGSFDSAAEYVHDY